MHRKIFSGRIDTSATGGELRYELDPKPGGRACKIVLYSLKVVQSSGDNVRLGIDLQTGPDGDVYGANRQVIVDFNPGTLVPSLAEGASGTPDTDATDVLGEWLRPTLKIRDGVASAAQWAHIELWETRKPF